MAVRPDAAARRIDIATDHSRPTTTWPPITSSKATTRRSSKCANAARPGRNRSLEDWPALWKNTSIARSSSRTSRRPSPPPREVARSLEGDCTEHAVLLAALCRARKIPARVAFGLVYYPPQKGFAYHMWNEVWIADRWIPLDATLGHGRHRRRPHQARRLQPQRRNRPGRDAAGDECLWPAGVGSRVGRIVIGHSFNVIVRPGPSDS